ncbi:hypothetical protein NL676_013717 [Syzygium grande]|nr:hypothetical protein NL676_013717 [Syzygium grande]
MMASSQELELCAELSHASFVLSLAQSRELVAMASSIQSSPWPELELCVQIEIDLTSTLSVMEHKTVDNSNMRCDCDDLGVRGPCVRRGEREGTCCA